MPAGSSSFAEVLQGRRRNGLFGQPPQIILTSNSKAVDIWKLARGTPANSHASEADPRTTTRDATRSGSSVGPLPKRNSVRGVEQLVPSIDDSAKKRLSELSVITSVRVPNTRHSGERRSWYLPDSGRTTPRPHTSGGPQAQEADDWESSIEQIPARPQTTMSDRTRPTTQAERSAIKAADADYHAALRRMGGQAPVAKRSNKLEKMFGGQAIKASQVQPKRKDSSFDLMDEGEEEEDEPTGLTAPPIPLRSPKRAPGTKISPKLLHRPSNSIDRSMHSSSVASTNNQDSEVTNLDSEIFTEDDDDASSFTSGPSSTTDELERRKPEPKTIAPPRAYASEGEQPAVSSSRINPTLANINVLRANQQAPTAPDAISCYDMLAMRSPTGVERIDFGASRVPALAKSSTEVLLGTAMEKHFKDLSRRPSSPALSDVSDESYDSALPPPVSLHRDYLGPKFRSRQEQKAAYKPKSKPVGAGKLAASASSTTLPKTKDRAGSLAKSSTAVDLTTRPAHLEPRSGSIVSASADYAGNGQRQGAGFSLKKLFARKKEEKLPEPTLQPLRKITFDSRGQKQIVDLNTSQRDISEFMIADPREVFGEAPSPRPNSTRSRSYSTRSMSISSSSKEVHQSYNNGQGSWRKREQGAPRRTAWK